MKATGQLKFTEQPDGSTTHEWTGGQRIEVSGQLIETLTERRPRTGTIVDVGGVQLRLIAPASTDGYQAYRDSYIAMCEGWRARLTWRYWQWLSDHAPSLFRWECKWLRRREVQPGEIYPKWSIVGILLRPLL